MTKKERAHVERLEKENAILRSEMMIAAALAGAALRESERAKWMRSRVYLDKLRALFYTSPVDR